MEKTKNKTTGNICIDMIAAALAHYKKAGRKVKVVNLSKSYWNIFERYMKSQPDADKVEITPDGVQFNNLLVRRGTRFQVQALECELHETFIVHE